MTVLLAADRRLIAVGGSLHPDTRGAHPFVRTAADAVRAAVASRVRAKASTVRVSAASSARGPWSRYQVSHPATAKNVSQPVLVRRVLYPQGDVLESAYQVIVSVAEPNSTTSFGYEYVVSAVDAAIVVP